MSLCCQNALRGKNPFSDPAGDRPFVQPPGPGKGVIAKGFFLLEASLDLEAQQRYFSYRAILVATVSQNYFTLVFVFVPLEGGYHTIIARHVAKWGIAQTFPCKTKYRTIWGSANLP